MHEPPEAAIPTPKRSNGKIFEGLDLDLYVCKSSARSFLVAADMVCGVVVLKSSQHRPEE